MLSDPEPLFEFDLEKVHVGEIPLTYDYRRRVARNGSFDGICFYFIAAFDEEIKIIHTLKQANVRPPGRLSYTGCLLAAFRKATLSSLN